MVSSKRRSKARRATLAAFCVIALSGVLVNANEQDQQHEASGSNSPDTRQQPQYDQASEATSAYNQAMQTLQTLTPPPVNSPPTLSRGTPSSYLTSLFPNAQGPIATAIRMAYKLKSQKWIPRWLSGKIERDKEDPHGSWSHLFSATPPKDAAQGKALKVLDLLEHAADLGSMDAVYKLAQLSLFPPISLPLNASRAFNYYSIHATETGNSTSQAIVGFFYATGYGGVVPVDQAKALLYYTFAAHGGDQGAEMVLGYRHWAGIGVNEDCMSALEWYESAGERAIAHFLTGPVGGRTLPRTSTRISDLDGGVYGPGASVASTGYNALRPVIKAAKARGAGETWEDLLEFYQFHADRDEVGYAYRLGRIHYQGGIYSAPGGIASGAEGVGALPRDYRRAHIYFTKVARHVWPNAPKPGAGKANLVKKEGVDEHTLVSASYAASYLGRMYLRGEGVKPDMRIAKIWFERGAEYGEKESYNGLGIIYRDGLVDNKVDIKYALECFKAAASQDLAEAQVNLGKYYYNRAEYGLATTYFETAIRNGSPFEAYYYIASIHAQRAQDPASPPSLSVGSCGIAVSFFKLVAERGSWRTDLLSEAERLWNTGEEENQKSARLRWWMAAEQGLDVAQNNLAYVLDQNKSVLRTSSMGLPSNETARLALVQWTRSAAQHDVDALVKVGDYYYHGLGVGDESEELRWEKAAGYYLSAVDSQRSALAMWNLGWMYENGIGVVRDFHLAKRYYDMALDTNSEAYLPVLLSLIKLHIRSFWYTLSGSSDKSLALWRAEPGDEDHWYIGKARDEFAKRWRGRKGDRATKGLDAKDPSREQERGGGGGTLETDDPIQWAKEQKENEIDRSRAEEEAYDRGDYFAGDYPGVRGFDDEDQDEFWETMFLLALCAAISALIYFRGRYVAREEQRIRREAMEQGGGHHQQRDRTAAPAQPPQDPDAIPDIGLFPPGNGPEHW